MFSACVCMCMLKISGQPTTLALHSSLNEIIISSCHLQDSSLSNDDAWAIALQQQRMFRDMWMDFAESQGFSFIEENDDNYDGMCVCVFNSVLIFKCFYNDTDPVSEWQSEVENSRDFYNSWRKHAQMINSELMFTDFDEVYVDEGRTYIHFSTVY